MAETEIEFQARLNALLDDLSGTVVEVAGFTNYNAELTRVGAQRILDRFRARGWKVPIERN